MSLAYGKICESDGKISHITFTSPNEYSKIKVVEDEFYIDLDNRVIYSMRDSTYYSYKEPNKIENKKFISSTEYATLFSHDKDSTTIIFDKSLPKHLTGELIFQNNENGIRKIVGRDYTINLISISKGNDINLNAGLDHAKKICQKAGPAKNLLFGY